MNISPDKLKGAGPQKWNTFVTALLAIYRPTSIRLKQIRKEIRISVWCSTVGRLYENEMVRFSLSDDESAMPLGFIGIFLWQMILPLSLD